MATVSRIFAHHMNYVHALMCIAKYDWVYKFAMTDDDTKATTAADQSCVDGGNKIAIHQISSAVRCGTGCGRRMPNGRPTHHSMHFIFRLFRPIVNLLFGHKSQQIDKFSFRTARSWLFSQNHKSACLSGHYLSKRKCSIRRSNAMELTASQTSISSNNE